MQRPCAVIPCNCLLSTHGLSVRNDKAVAKSYGWLLDTVLMTGWAQQHTDLTSNTCLDALIGARMISPPFARCRVFKNSAGADRYGSATCKRIVRLRIQDSNGLIYRPQTLHTLVKKQICLEFMAAVASITARPSCFLSDWLRAFGMPTALLAGGFRTKAPKATSGARQATLREIEGVLLTGSVVLDRQLTPHERRQ